MAKGKDLTGRRFGRLTVISLNEEVTKQKKRSYWNCLCDCGNVVVVRGSSLTGGDTKSCGCSKVEDLTGQRFGRLTVIKEYGRDKQGRVLWLCRCDCGKEKVIRGDSLKSGNTKSCGFCDMTGKKYGRLTVIKEYGRDKQGRVLWLCRCDCGSEVIVYSCHLKSGATKSCGCLQKEKISEINYKGGITLISEHLRKLQVVKQWRKDTYTRENNRCQLTGKQVHGGNSDVHHLYGFNMIVLDAHNTYNIQIKEQVKDYTEEELKLLEDYVAEWHKDTSNAVLLCEEVHNLFHNCKDEDGNVLYGYGDNTPEQFEEFRERYLNGEFDSKEDVAS